LITHQQMKTEVGHTWYAIIDAKSKLEKSKRHAVDIDVPTDGGRTAHVQVSRNGGCALYNVIQSIRGSTVHEFRVDR